MALTTIKARIDYLNRLAHGPLELEGVRIDAITHQSSPGRLRLSAPGRRPLHAFITDNELGADQGKRMPNLRISPGLRPPDP